MSSTRKVRRSDFSFPQVVVSSKFLLSSNFWQAQDLFFFGEFENFGEFKFFGEFNSHQVLASSDLPRSWRVELSSGLGEFNSSVVILSSTFHWGKNRDNKVFKWLFLSVKVSSGIFCK